jgi:hypothetical protein
MSPTKPCWVRRFAPTQRAGVRFIDMKLSKTTLIESVEIVLIPWIGPIITYVEDDPDRLAFIVWPFVYAVIMAYVNQLGRYRNIGGKYSRRLSFAKFSASTCLCLFEVIANCLAPLSQRFPLALCFYVPYLVATFVALDLIRRMKKRVETEHAVAEYASQARQS